jgi:hypothetical protein
MTRSPPQRRLWRLAGTCCGPHPARSSVALKSEVFDAIIIGAG